MAQKAPIPAPKKAPPPPAKAAPPAPVKAPAPPVKAAPPGKAPPVNQASAPAPVKAPTVAGIPADLAALLASMATKIEGMASTLATVKERNKPEPIPFASVLHPDDPTFGGTIDPATDWREPHAAYCRDTSSGRRNTVKLAPNHYDAEKEGYVLGGAESEIPRVGYVGYPRDTDQGYSTPIGKPGKAKDHAQPPKGASHRNAGLLAFYDAISEDGLNLVGAPFAYLRQSEAEALLIYPAEPTDLEKIQALPDVTIEDGSYWAPIGLDGKPMKGWLPLPV